MVVLRIEHHTSDYDRWKELFDADPLGRASRQVRHHRVLRRADDPGQVCIELAFDSVAEAESMRAALGALWQGPAAAIIDAPVTGVYDIAEDQAY